MRFSGAATKRDAIVTATVEFNRRHRAEEFIRVFGTFTSIMSDEEIEAEQTRQEDEPIRVALRPPSGDRRRVAASDRAYRSGALERTLFSVPGPHHLRVCKGAWSGDPPPRPALRRTGVTVTPCRTLLM